MSVCVWLNNFVTYCHVINFSRDLIRKVTPRASEILSSNHHHVDDSDLIFPSDDSEENDIGRADLGKEAAFFFHQFASFESFYHKVNFLESCVEANITSRWEIRWFAEISCCKLYPLYGSYHIV